MTKISLAFGQDTKNKQSFLFSGFVLILVVLVSLFWLRPKAMAIVKANRDLTASRKTLAELTKKVTTLDGLSKPELTDKVDLVLRILPVEKDVPTVLSILKKVALNNELIVNEMSMAEVGEVASDSAEAETSKNVEEEALPSLPVELILIGSREKIINFFKQVETTAPLMKVNSLSISQKNEVMDEFLIEVWTYFLPLPKTMGKLEQAVIPLTLQEEKIFNELASFKIFEKSVFEETSSPSATKLDLFSY
jgi:Tfp pilus assembly protein PilO